MGWPGGFWQGGRDSHPSGVPSHIHYRTVQELFSLNGFAFWEAKPMRRQSSASCSEMYLFRWLIASEVFMRSMLASLCSCSTSTRSCWWLDIWSIIMLLSVYSTAVRTILLVVGARHKPMHKARQEPEKWPEREHNLAFLPAAAAAAPDVNIFQ